MLAINPATPYDVIRYLLPDLAGVIVPLPLSMSCRAVPLPSSLFSSSTLALPPCRFM